MKRKPEYWLTTDEFKGYIILDPDGWDRSNFKESWNKPITKQEMWGRLMQCTIQMSKERHENGDFNKSIEINKDRFKMSDQLVSIFKNTALLLHTQSQLSGSGEKK